MKITLDLSPETGQRVAELARREGISADEYAQRIIDRFLADEQRFQEAVNYVLDKNAELYRRLARS